MTTSPSGTAAPARPEFETFAKTLPLSELDATPERHTLTASGDDLARLAAFLNVPGVDALSGEATVAKHGPLVRVDGVLRARLERQCVASLEPMEEVVEEPFSVTFTEEIPDVLPNDEVEADLDAPEPLHRGVLDLADVFLEQLVLAISPHPRKTDAEGLVDPRAGEKISPFDILERLRGGQ